VAAKSIIPKLTQYQGRKVYHLRRQCYELETKLNTLSSYKADCELQLNAIQRDLQLQHKHEKEACRKQIALCEKEEEATMCAHQATQKALLTSLRCPISKGSNEYTGYVKVDDVERDRRCLPLLATLTSLLQPRIKQQKGLGKVSIGELTLVSMPAQAVNSAEPVEVGLLVLFHTSSSLVLAYYYLTFTLQGNIMLCTIVSGGSYGIEATKLDVSSDTQASIDSRSGWLQGCFTLCKTSTSSRHKLSPARVADLYDAIR
jgi:hypothetical protein